MYVVLLALHDAKQTTLQGVPNGHLYAQLLNEWEIGEWTLLISSMCAAGSITEQNHLLKITDKGEDLLKKLDEIYKEAQQKGIEK